MGWGSSRVFGLRTFKRRRSLKQSLILTLIIAKSTSVFNRASKILLTVTIDNYYNYYYYYILDKMIDVRKNCFLDEKSTGTFIIGVVFVLRLTSFRIISLIYVYSSSSYKPPMSHKNRTKFTEYFYSRIINYSVIIYLYDTSNKLIHWKKKCQQKHIIFY